MINIGAIRYCSPSDKQGVQTHDSTTNKNMIKSGNRRCKVVPQVNGKWLRYSDIFKLYSPDIGKPPRVILLYQKSQLVDIKALQGVADVNGRTLPECLGTIFRMNEDFECVQYEN